MISPSHSGPDPISDADLSDAFGFGLDDESWVDRLRTCASAPGMGRLGEFELLSELGRGGQGVVFKARQPRTGRIVAVKRLGSFATPAMRSRFEREVEATSALNHPNIVTVFGSEIVDEQAVLAMQWIDGEPIVRWAAGHDPPRLPPSQGGIKGGSRRPVREILEVFSVVCDAVHHAHQRGVIHRDIKPSNILVDADDNPHVLDFGLARLFSPFDNDSLFQSHTTGFVGTPAYASPEQLGAEDGAVDVRTDVFSLGCTLYHALTGSLPHEGRGTFASVIRSIEQHDPRPPSALRPDLGRELDAIVLKALAKTKAERYQSVDAFAEDIRRYISGDPVLAHPPSAWYHARKLIRRHRTAFTLSVALLVLIVAFAVTASVLALREHEARRDAEWNAYSASLAAADAAVRAGDFATAQGHLQRAPRRLRGWEWRYLARQSDDSETSRHLPYNFFPIDAEGDPLAEVVGTELRRLKESTVPAVAVLKFGRLGELPFSRELDYFLNPGPAGLTQSVDHFVSDAGGRALARLSPGGITFYFAQFSPDNQALVGSDDLGQLLVFPFPHPTEAVVHQDSQEPAPSTVPTLAVEKIKLHDAQIDSLCFSGDGRLIATGAGDGQIQVFDFPQRRILHTLSTGERSISALAFHPTANRLVAGSWDGRVALWDLDSAQQIWTASGHHGLVSALDFSPDTEVIASGSWDKTICYWDAKTGAALGRSVGHGAEIESMAFFGSEGRLASYDRSRTLKTWRWNRNDVAVARGDFHRILGVAMAAGSSARWLGVLEGPDSTWRNPRVSIVDPRRRVKVGDLYVAEGSLFDLSAMDASADGTWLAAGTYEGTVLLWNGDELADYASRGPGASMPTPIRITSQTGGCEATRSNPGVNRFNIGGPACSIISVSVSFDNRRLALSRLDGTVEIWDIDSRSFVLRYPATTDGKTRICAFSPDGLKLGLMEGRDGLCILDASDGRVLAERRVEGAELWIGLRFSPDGKLLVPLMFENDIRLFHTSDLSDARLFVGHVQFVYGVAFSPDGSRLASAGADSTIRLWDLATGREVAVLHDHEAAVTSVAFTSDGRTLISGGFDNTVRFWDSKD